MATTVITDATAVVSLLDRHRVVVLDVPSGHGRGELLRTLAATPGTVVVDAPNGPQDAARVVAELDAALVSGCERVVVDEVHRGGDELTEELSRRCHQPPGETAPLVIGGTGLRDLALGELLVSGSAVLLTTDRLPFLVDDASAGEVLAQARRRDLAPSERRLLDAAVSTGVDRVDVLTRFAADLGAPDAVRSLSKLPLLEVGPTHLEVDPRWSTRVDPPVDEDGGRLADALLAVGPGEAELRAAGRLATGSGDAELLRRVVRTALGSHPPRVGVHTLRSWRESGLLAGADPHAAWLDGVCGALHGARLDRALADLETARAGFEADDDTDAEVDVGLALGIVARRAGDLSALAGLIGRAEELERAGVGRTATTRLLGEALLQQMSGDPDGALGTLERIPPDAFDGDWAAQVLMMRGTNLLLCGRPAEATAQLTAATGVGSAWSYATALYLLATARWSTGDGDRAVGDLEVAHRHARRVGALVASDLARATRAAMLAALGDPNVDHAIADAATGDHLDDEGRRLLQVARALQAAGDGALERARELLDAIDPPHRAVLSTCWTVALQTALGADPHGWAAVAERHDALRAPLEAGQAAAAHLGGGAPAPSPAAPFLPAAWCEPGAEVVELELLGAATARRNRRVVEHRAWDRGRVRELALHLAMVDDSSRELTAGRLWPDLAPDAAARNLRVTLSHLLDVLDPDRPRGSGSDLIDEHRGVLRFADTARLRIDVRRAAAAARDLVDADAAGDERSLLAAARTLAREPSGQLLAGGPVGEWVEPHIRIRSDVMLRAVSAAAPTALRAGDPELAEELLRRGLELDPWAERLHQLLVRARLARDDLDGARRAWRQAIAQLDELGVEPEPATVRLGAELGLR